MLIDTHAHINFSAYKDDGDEVIKRALKNNVWLINVGSQKETSARAIECASRFKEGVWAAIALHPIHLKNRQIEENVDEYESFEFLSRAEKFDYEEYKNLAKNPKVVAIGETGLDYYHLKEERPEDQPEIKELQKEIFLRHLELAKDLDKPLIIHCREAHNDVLEILKKYCNNAPHPPLNLRGGEGELRGVVHSFSGRWSQAQQYLEMGFYLGFNGIITFARDYDKVILNMPLERLLIETDCPYLAPAPYRGQRNEPLYVKYVAEKIAELRGVSFEKIAKITTENARRLFDI